MKSLRNRLERGFENFARFVYRHRIKTLVVMLLLMGPPVLPGLSSLSDKKVLIFLKQ